MTPIERRIVALDLFVSLSAATTGLLTAASLGVALEWIGVAAAVGAGSLAAAADRSDVGLGLLVAGLLLAMAAVVWVVAARPVPAGVVPVLLVGVGAGVAANRIVFGVFRDVPPARISRQRSA